jgi:hypothetical protein
MKKKILLPLMAVIGLLIAGPVAAQSGNTIEARLTLPEGQLTVGDPIELNLSVTHPEGYQVIMPQLETQWGDFVVRSQSAPKTISNGNGTETTSQVIDLRLFAPGSYSTLPLAVTVTDGLGGVNEVLAMPAEVTINSVLIEGDTELRDIKPQVELPFTNLLPWIIAGLLLGLGGIVMYLFIRWQRKRRALAALDNRLPHEVALDVLDHIEGLALPDQGRLKEHYTLVSDVMRTYMEKRYEVAMIERTTAEIQKNLVDTEIEAKIAGQYLSLLDISDLVKFSKFSPEPASAYSLLTSARQIVIASKSVDDSVEEEHDTPGAGLELKAEVQSGPGLSNNGNYRQTEVSA